MKQDHPEVKFGKTGVLIINLGTPDSTSWWDIRKYLKEFLSDRRVIEVNPVILVVFYLHLIPLIHIERIGILVIINYSEFTDFKTGTYGSKIIVK